MTLEAETARCADALTRIADVLEAQHKIQLGLIPTPDAGEVAADAANKPGKKKKKKGKKNTTKKILDTEAPPADDPSEDLTHKEDVRKALQAVQSTNGRDAAVAILKKFKVKTLSQLKPDDYQAVLDACEAVVSE